jgi:hypothetical protein
MTLAARMRALSEEIARLQTEIGILDEQIAFQSEVADDARLRAVVSETPLSERESREAADDLLRMVRVRTEALQRVQALRAEQDALLEGLLEHPDPA